MTGANKRFKNKTFGTNSVESETNKERTDLDKKHVHHTSNVFFMLVPPRKGKTLHALL
jgi:hypothetical protein